MIRRALAVVAACFLFTGAFSQTITTGVINPTTYCAGAAINVPFTSVGVYTAGNVYTAELSTAAGTFPGTPIGSLASTANTGTIAAVIPFTQGSGTTYRVRVSSTTPVSAMIPNGINLTVNALGINAPTFAGTTFCPNQTFNITYTLNGNCNFPNTPANNVFNAELSDGFGNFAAPTIIGSRTGNNGGTISVTIPTTASAATGYRIRVRSTNPGAGLTSPDNGADFTVNAIAVNTITSGATSYCAGATFNVSYTLASSCQFFAGNQMTVQLSDGTGSFASPTNIGTATSTNGGNISVTIPQTQPAGTGYRFRLVSNNPVRTSVGSLTDITVNQFGINAPVIASTSFCQGSAVAVPYTIQNSCTFPNTPTNNTFTAQLSNSSGSFASPTNIGFATSNNNGTINAVIPVGTPAGTGYRIRVVSLNPTGGPITSADNGTNLSVTAAVGNPTVFGSSTWNAYVYSGTNATITNNVYLGMYTEPTLNFNTTNRWPDASGPTFADASSGTAYSGCAGTGTNYSVSFKRTNFSCNYYQIDIPYHDDDVRLFVNGVQVFSHAPGCCDLHTNAYTTFLNASSTVEFQFINFGGPGRLQVSIAPAANPLTVTPAQTICNGSSTTLTASGPAGLSYAWSPTTGLTPASGLGATVTAAPTTTTSYTVFATDAATNCQVTRVSTITVVPAGSTPTVTVTNSTPTICSGITATTLTASGAGTYTWSPAAGLSSTTGNTVIANPAVTTTYTVTGSTGAGCNSNTATATVTVQNVPTTPTPGTFGNGVWNVYSHNNMTFSNYYGFYSENNLSFNTATRWNPANGPHTANAATGTAYQGCNVSTTNNSMSFMRTNFTCGYYTLSSNYHDDGFTVLVNGVQVFQNNGFASVSEPNVWSGFLNATSTVELRLVNTGGPGRLDISLATTSGPQVLSPNVVICPNTGTDLTSSAAAFPNATFAWSISPNEPTITFVPGTNVANTRLQTTLATPSQVYTLTNTMTDAGPGGTGCTATRTLTVTVAATPTVVITPASATIVCPTQTVTLTASGANTYTWSPATGLSATTGNVVIAQPTTTTTYTVTGDNNCATDTETVTVTVVPLPDYNTFPTGVWNIYGFASPTIGTNYTGFYTDNGTGTPNWSFNSGTRWGMTQPPSVAPATNGAAWQGCTMPTTNYSMSAKRRGFACGVYQIDIPAHDDWYILFINGQQVSQHLTGTGDAHTAAWTGVLNTNSTIELQFFQNTGNAFFGITFTQIAQPAGTTVWTGATSTDWFTAGNWCSAVPTTTLDALIPALGPQNMPTIGGAGAVARNITINAGVAAGTFNPALAAANLTMGAFNLDVNGNWVNNGTLTAGTGTVSFVGAGSGNTISGATLFNNVTVNKANGIASSGTQQIGGVMTFTNGVVTATGTLRFLAGSSVASVSNNSYVDGVVTKVGNTTFTFPVGKAGLWRPINISAPSTITDTYTAQYFNTSALGSYPNANRAVTLDHVSNAEYWMLNRTAGTSSVITSLSWDSNSGGVANLPTLRVAGWNGSLWADLGNQSTSGNTAKGTITGTTATTFSGPYTLASTVFINALPVQLSGMVCGINSFGNPQIDWKTEVEVNSDYFQIERSFDGEKFEAVGRVTLKGDSRMTQSYSFEDFGAPDGKMYYRLKQVDRDGRFEYFQVCAMTVISGGLSVTPNPTSGTATIKLHGDDLRELTVMNSIGQVVPVSYSINNAIIEMDLAHLAPGVYLVRVTTGKKSGVLKLVKS